MSGADPRASFASYLERLSASGFRPSRRFGQNFLLEPALHRAVVEAAEVGADDTVLEIGGGLGFLTRELAARAARVVVAEIDERLADLLQEDFASQPQVEVVRGDACGRDDAFAEPLEQALLRARAAAPSGRLRLAANLPYAVAGPLLVAAAVREGAEAIAAMGVLVQLEVAERIAAAPHTAEYGSLPALLQSFYRVRLLRRVGPEVFRPRPRVDSAILALHAREVVHPAVIHRRHDYARFLRALFGNRRKTLRHAFDRLVPDWRARPAIDASLATRRAEELDPDQLAALFAAVGEGTVGDGGALETPPRPS
ncbi:MAG: 16S rRNA (adenine(1518)-N(6)/adenine(1519)-N(6))-dimethyltransferase RsmA [Planctomycetota bacterium]